MSPPADGLAWDGSLLLTFIVKSESRCDRFV